MKSPVNQFFVNSKITLASPYLDKIVRLIYYYQLVSLITVCSYEKLYCKL